MNKTKNYRYVIELDSPLWPRKLADALNCGGLADQLVSVTDLQNAGHIYGATYRIRAADEKRRPTVRTFGFIPALR